LTEDNPGRTVAHMNPAPIKSFVGRVAELAALDRHYGAPKAALVPVYGRRRVGKTELLLRFIDKKPAVYFTASNKLRAPQIVDFVRAAADWLNASHLAETAPTSWESALRLVVAAAPKQRKLVLVLDEFQWLCESSPELPSVLQRLWDMEWQRGNRLFVVLCGSYVGFMEREVLGARSPLFGRRAADLRIEPFGFREASCFHPGWSRVEQARAYFVCGGIPAYLQRFDVRRSVAQNVAREFFSIDAFFQREPDFLLREELSEVKQATSILEAVALGRVAQSQIGSAIGLSSSALAPHLKNLVSLGYLERLFPLVPNRKPSRTSVVYRIADPLLRFWFRFLEPHWSTLRRHTPERAFEQIVAPQWESYCGDGFERLCRAAMPLLYEDERVSSGFEIGEYWDRDTQIDVVGVRADGWIDLGECRWSPRASVPEALRELEQRQARYLTTSQAFKYTIGKRIFVQSKPKSTTRSVTVHTLSDLYGD